MNLPNKITIGRIIIVFVIVILASIYYKFPPEVAYTIQVIAALLAVIAGFSDVLDGMIARKYNLVSDFGKLIDPLADKIFVMAVFIVFVDTVNPYTNHPMLPGWVVVVVLGREFLVTGLRSLAATKGEVIQADKYGKLKTFSQMIFFVFGGFIWLNILPLKGTVLLCWFIAMGIVVGITFFSGLNYFIKYKHLYVE